MNELRLLKITRQEGVDFVEISNPPTNILDQALAAELWRYVESVAREEDVAVIVFNSANPDFYVAHHDAELFLKQDTEVAQTALSDMHRVIQTLRQWDKVTIAQLRGRASGGGSEFIMAMDLRFAAMGKTFIRQPEVSLGFVPCKGGTQMLPHLIGRARALEMMLDGKFLNSDQLEKYGYINHALAAPALSSFVKKLALRIASHPRQAVRALKTIVNQNDSPAFEVEQRHFNQLIRTDECRHRLQTFVDFAEERPEGEMSLGEPHWARK